MKIKRIISFEFCTRINGKKKKHHRQQELCQKLQDSNTTLEKEKATLQHRFTEISQKIRDFNGNSDQLYTHHEKLSGMLSKLLRIDNI